jgi:hypothetical protein
MLKNLATPPLITDMPMDAKNGSKITASALKFNGSGRKYKSVAKADAEKVAIKAFIA